VQQMKKIKIANSDINASTSAVRLKDICKASQIEMTRQEWYEIYKAAGNKLP
jgi:predicted oxidoreductase